ncbi:Uncharacterized protein PHSC3_000863 [Chlamydiales bacterium STE3]|nr:Uncharacterized protein PHSC3_000863 [Chlamydiales bacterium STE3]
MRFYKRFLEEQVLNTSVNGSNPKNLPSKKKPPKSSLHGFKNGQASTSSRNSLIKPPREAAFLALCSAEKGESYLQEWLEDWRTKNTPGEKDERLAQEIAFGTMRMQLTLDSFASQLADNQKIKLKPKVRILLRTALYQATMMDKIPLYALVNETVRIAKKYFSIPTANFLNALLRKIEGHCFSLPEGSQPQELSLRFSYPLALVENLIKTFGEEKTKGILEVGNQPPKLMVRKLHTSQIEMQQIESTSLHAFMTSLNFYIQNSTPATLFHHLASANPFDPQVILDLCASPGGKLLLAHDYFPTAKLFANDISEAKLRKLKENIEKYQLQVDISCGPGESYPKGRSFDLIIADVPCSNTGVLNKRPEARWRFSESSLENLKATALSIVGHATTLLAPNGRIWFMTCSILKEENEDLIAEICQKLSMKCTHQELILPHLNGADGGFAAELQHKK